MLKKSDITKAANDLYHAEIDRQQIDPITRTYADMTLADSYAIQKHWVDQKITDGKKVVGYKIGYTSRAMQKALHIDEPDYGVLLDHMLFAEGSDIEAAQFCDPRIEAELAFILKEDLKGANVTLFQVLNATDYIIPALEIIAARSYRVHPQDGYKRTLLDTVADNAGNAGIIMGGKPIRPTEVDLRWCGVLLSRNGVLEETGLSAGVLNHPAHGICWVAKRFAPHGITLKERQIILAGAFTAPIAVKAGDTIHADYGRLGSIACHFI